MAHNIYLGGLGPQDPSSMYTKYMVARCYNGQGRNSMSLSSSDGLSSSEGLADGFECDAECPARFEEWREQFGRAAVTCCYAKLPWKPVL